MKKNISIFLAGVIFGSFLTVGLAYFACPGEGDPVPAAAPAVDEPKEQAEIKPEEPKQAEEQAPAH